MPGTVVVPEDAFLANLRAIIAGLWNMGFRKQIFLNGHGQEEVIPLALHQWAKKYQVPAVLVSLHWETVIHDHLKTKEYGGPFETPFAHADEAEASYSLALFPEFCDMSLAVDNKPFGFIPKGHVDGGGEVYHRPIKGHEHIGLSGSEVNVYRKASSAARRWHVRKGLCGPQRTAGLHITVITDIMTAFPAGKLPPADMVTQRDPKEIEDLLKGFAQRRKHLHRRLSP